MTLISGNNMNSNNINSGQTRPKACLDTSVFVALFGQEEGKWQVTRDILQDARGGRVQVVVSSLVLIECEPGIEGGIAAGLGGGVEQGSDDTQSGARDPQADFFESEFLTRCNVDPFTGELARRLRRELRDVTTLASPTLASGAWLWLATALLTECDYLMTYERRLHKLAGQAVLGKLQVGPPVRPWDAGQLSIADVDGVMAAAPIIGTVWKRTVEI